MIIPNGALLALGFLHSLPGLVGLPRLYGVVSGEINYNPNDFHAFTPTGPTGPFHLAATCSESDATTDMA